MKRKYFFSPNIANTNSHFFFGEGSLAQDNLAANSFTYSIAFTINEIDLCRQLSEPLQELS